MGNCFAGAIQWLEPPVLCSAAVVEQIPTQAITAGQPTPVIYLPAFLEDTAIPNGDTVVDIQTDLPSPDNSIPLELTNAATPKTVANFLQYISSGEYANTVISRSVPGFIIQGGGYTTGGIHIHSLGTIPSEADTETLTNTPGTIAMALGFKGPGTATSDWFFNLVDNNETLNSSGDGPYTTFGQVIYNGLNALDDIANLPIVDDQGVRAFTNLPVQSGTNGDSVASVAADNFITTNPVVLPGGVNYSAASSDPNVASATVSNGILSFSPIGSGTTNITVTATDLAGGTATSTFALNVTGLTAATNFSLGVVKSTLPAQAILGSHFAGKVTVDVTNQSSSTQKGPLTVNLYALADGASDAASTLLASLARKGVTIKAGKTLALVFPVIKLPPGLVAGSYTIIARTLDSQGSLSSVGVGSALTVTAPLIDLTGTVVMSPTFANVGQTFSLTLDLSNSGNIPATGPLQISFALSDSLAGTDPFSLETVVTHINLKPGATMPAHLKVHVPLDATAGVGYLVTTVDPLNVFANPDPSKNTSVVPLITY